MNFPPSRFNSVFGMPFIFLMELNTLRGRVWKLYFTHEQHTAACLSEWRIIATARVNLGPKGFSFLFLCVCNRPGQIWSTIFNLLMQPVNVNYVSHRLHCARPSEIKIMHGVRTCAQGARRATRGCSQIGLWKSRCYAHKAHCAITHFPCKIMQLGCRGDLISSANASEFKHNLKREWNGELV